MAILEVSESALIHNVQCLRQMSQSQLMAVVKADAYGHGALPVATLLAESVDHFAVARIDEAVALRQAGITTPILLLEGFFSEQELLTLVEYQFDTVVHHQSQIEALQQLMTDWKPSQSPITVWLKVDTGMHRLGFSESETLTAFSTLLTLPCIRKPIHVMSHFANSDEPMHSLNQIQIERFESVYAKLQAISDSVGARSLSATAGIFAFPHAHYEVIRPGLSLYGISPFNDDPIRNEGAALGLRPAMRLSAPLLVVRSHAAGEPVGYGSTWHSKNETKLGVVAMGYGDGYPRSIKEGTPVVVNGRRVPIVGRVSMDMIVIDLGADSYDCAGDTVIFWGEELPVEQIAAHNDLSVYELITRLTSRLDLRYVK